MKRILGISLGLVFLAAVGFAQSADDLNTFKGTWKCTGVAFASDMGPEHKTTATVVAKWAVGNKWMEMHYVEAKSKANPQPIDALILMSHDAALKKIVAGFVDSMGGYGTEESSGWSNDTMLLTGVTNGGGMRMNYRETFTRKGNTLTHVGEGEMNGTWKKFDEETCKRVSS